MLKGVNKQIVEINNPNNEYFEKAILFVKAEKLYLPQEMLSNQAYKYLNTLGKPKKYNTGKIVFISVLLLFLAAAVIVTLTLL